MLAKPRQYDRRPVDTEQLNFAELPCSSKKIPHRGVALTVFVVGHIEPDSRVEPLSHIHASKHGGLDMPILATAALDNRSRPAYSQT